VEHPQTVLAVVAAGLGVSVISAIAVRAELRRFYRLSQASKIGHIEAD